MKKVNPYYSFLEQLLDDYRLTANGFQEKYGIRSFSSIMNKLKKDPNKKLHPETIAKIENALNIKIDDRDPDNITYRRLEPVFDGAIPVNEYPVLSEVYAGEPEYFDIELYDEKAPFVYNRFNHRCFALRVNGHSMETTLRDGDIVLVDMDLLPVDGDLVAVKLRNGKQYIKRYYKINDYLVKLSSDNPDYDVRIINTNDIVAVHPVVAINLNLRNRNGDRK